MTVAGALLVATVALVWAEYLAALGYTRTPRFDA